MAKREILFNDEAYSIEESIIEASLAEMKSHLVDDYSGSGTTIVYDGTTIIVDSAKLATAASNLAATLNSFAGSGASIVVNGVTYGIDSAKLNSAKRNLGGALGKMTGAEDEPSMAPGLYQTGAIALFREGNVEDASAMMTTSWDELVESGAIAISEGEDVELPDMNEYGFYYGVPYSLTAEGMTIAFTFNEDGSAIMNQAGEIMEMPAGLVIYGDHSIDMTALNMPVFIVSADGTAIEAEGITLAVGSGLPPKGTVYLGTVNGELPVFEGDLVLPNDGRATAIVTSAFYNQELLTGVAIPNSVMSIGPVAFANCSSLISITIPDGITRIGNNTFENCSSLTNITISNSVTDIGEYAFHDCSSLTSINIPDSVTSIGEWAFCRCSSLTSITIPNSVTSIGEDAFELCDNIKSVYIKDLSSWCAIEFGDSPLYHANLYLNGELVTDLIIPDGVTTIRNKVFYGCSSLTSINIPDSVTSIGRGAFFDCKGLTSITIPDSVASIGQDAFRYCTNLTNIMIGKGVTSIGHFAFYECGSLTSITFEGTVAEWNAITFGSEWKGSVPATEVICSDGQVAL